MKKMYALSLVFVMAVLGCSKTQLAESPTETVPTESPAAVLNSGVGTEGGGGTLVFAFRQGAMSAKKAMEQFDDISSKDSLHDGLNVFYRMNRERWIKALEHFVFDPELVEETNEALLENDILVGAKSVPVNAPTKVRLSVPYLSGKEGFTLSKAFALAIHEGGHFAKPDISKAEHPYLDQIANLLFNKRSGIVPETEYRVRLDFALDASRVHLASDNRTLMLSTRNHEAMIIDLESGLRFVDKGARILNQNWVETSQESQVTLKNQVTREKITMTVPQGYSIYAFREDERTAIFRKYPQDSEAGSILQRNLRNGEEHAIDTLPRAHMGNYFSEGFRMEIQNSDHGAVIYDLQKQQVLDLVKGGQPFSSDFISNKLALIWWYDRSPGFELELRKIGDKTLAKLEASRYLGQISGPKGKQLVFSRHSEDYVAGGILFYDLESEKQSFVALADLAEVTRFGAQSQAVLKKRDGSLWLTDLMSPEKEERVSDEEIKEEVHGTYSTTEGRVLLTQEKETNTLVVRFLDRGEK